MDVVKCTWCGRNLENTDYIIKHYDKAKQIIVGRFCNGSECRSRYDASIDKTTRMGIVKKRMLVWCWVVTAIAFVLGVSKVGHDFVKWLLIW